MVDLNKVEVMWEPHPGPQTEVLKRDEFEILYGGARGGGKTSALIAWMAEEVHNPKFRGLVLRRNSDDLKDFIDRSNQLYSQMGARMAGVPAEFRWPSGAVIRTGHLKDDQSYTKYQGHEYHRIGLEELTQIPSEKNYLRLLASCRSSTSEIKPHVFATTNPGEVGHKWVRRRFIDPKEPGQTIWYNVKMPDGTKIWRSRIFIQSTIDDNPSLIKNDPGYVATLEEMKARDPKKYRAWRFGDWDIFEGQVFDEWSRTTHVIKPVTPSAEHQHLLSVDWGYAEASAFAAYLTAVIPMQTEDGQAYNQLITYKEWYGNKKSPKEWASIIYRDCQVMGIKPEFGVCDPSMYSSSTGGKSIAKMIQQEWFNLYGEWWTTLRKGSNTGRNSRINRVGIMHGWMSTNPASKLPYWLVTENCVNFIRTIPMLVADESVPEAYDTKQEDHSADSLAYLLEKIRFVAVDPGPADYRVDTASMSSVDLFDKMGRSIGLDPEEFANQYE